MKHSFHQQFVKYPHSYEIDPAEKVVEFYCSRNGCFLPAVVRQGTIDADPKAQVLVILADDDLLFAALRNQFPESAPRIYG